MLDVKQHLANGARRAALLTFRRTSEAALRDELLPAFKAWVNGYVDAVTAYRPDGPCLDGTLDQQYATIDAMRARQTINDHDARALKSHASRPFIAALVAQIHSGQVDRHDVQRTISQITDMHRAGEITTHQVQQIRRLADPVLNPPPPARPQRSPRMDDSTRIELLETLARLRSTGALTEHEYQAEKQRLRDN